MDAQRELLENPVLLVVRIWLKEAPEPRLESIFFRRNSWHMLLAALPPFPFRKIAAISIAARKSEVGLARRLGSFPW